MQPIIVTRLPYIVFSHPNSPSIHCCVSISHSLYLLFLCVFVIPHQWRCMLFDHRRLRFTAESPPICLNPIGNQTPSSDSTAIIRSAAVSQLPWRHSGKTMTLLCFLVRIRYSPQFSIPFVSIIDLFPDCDFVWCKAYGLQIIVIEAIKDMFTDIATITTISEVINQQVEFCLNSLD